MVATTNDDDDDEDEDDDDDEHDDEDDFSVDDDVDDVDGFSVDDMSCRLSLADDESDPCRFAVVAVVVKWSNTDVCFIVSVSSSSLLLYTK